MGVKSVVQEVKVKVSRWRMFKALAIEAGDVLPKATTTINTIQILEGRAFEPGCVFKTNFPEGNQLLTSINIQVIDIIQTFMRGINSFLSFFFSLHFSSLCHWFCQLSIMCFFLQLYPYFLNLIWISFHMILFLILSHILTSERDLINSDPTWLKFDLDYEGAALVGLGQGRDQIVFGSWNM